MYLRSTEYKFKHIYNITTLKNYCDYAECDIKQAERVIQQIRKYQQDLFDHVQNVLNTEMKPVVYLHRSINYSTKKKEYRIFVEIRPQVEKEQIDGHRVNGEYKEQKNFTGTERNSAFKYAEELAKKYRCPIEKTGYWRM
ncbi:hypothetical protein [Paenibacillus elgii]|uniref:hypothetical protein n=1 Tax=Paenibacillus elgii TaxID=189691 RepID=UPI0013D59E50|nr:hypothetical protein [Paenibacillus elgii]